MPDEEKERQRLRAIERSRAWRLANPERAKALAQIGHEKRDRNWDAFLEGERRRYRRNTGHKLSRQKIERAKNPELFRERLRRHYQSNKEMYAASVAARRARKLNATPDWVDLGAIKKVYAEAQRLSLETGHPHEVDHIHPLKGKNFCGLHVHWNLQILPRYDNRSKAARLPSDNPKLQAA